jgi:hypothetical protein
MMKLYMSSIITLTDLEAYTGETIDPTKGALVVAAVNDYIEHSTGRSWGATETVTGEMHDYAPVIFLRHQDVAGVSKVERGQGTNDRTTLAVSEYFVNNVGRLVLSENRIGFRKTRDFIHVDYTYGVSTVPGDLKLAALALASDFNTYATDGQKEVSSEGIGSYRLTYASGASSATGKVHFDTIASYRTRRV